MEGGAESMGIEAIENGFISRGTRMIAVILVKADPGVRPGLRLGNVERVACVRREEAGFASGDCFPVPLEHHVSLALVAGEKIAAGGICADDVKRCSCGDNSTVFDEVCVEQVTGFGLVKPWRNGHPFCNDRIARLYATSEILVGLCKRSGHFAGVRRRKSRPNM